MDIYEQVLPKLIWAEGQWTTKNGAPGDAMSANAAFAAAFPLDDRPKKYVDASFIGDRPFRSPLHVKDPNVDLENSFSRDHTLSLCWYSLWSGDMSPLQKISRYASSHWLKIGKEGSYSQHGLTPNVMWAMHSVCKFYRDNSMPWYYKTWPSVSIAAIQLASAKSVKVGYRLNLCGELSLIARITGQWNGTWQKVIDTCVERHPENLYYLYIQGKTSETYIRAQLAREVAAYQPSDQWCWNNFEKTSEGRLLACGQELLLMDSLLNRGCVKQK